MALFLKVKNEFKIFEFASDSAMKDACFVTLLCGIELFSDCSLQIFMIATCNQSPHPQHASESEQSDKTRVQVPRLLGSIHNVYFFRHISDEHHVPKAVIFHFIQLVLFTFLSELLLKLCYAVNERISSNQNRVFLNFKIRFKYVLIYVERSEKVQLT